MSASIEALHQKSSHCSDDSSLHLSLTSLCAKSQGDKAGEGMPNTMVIAWRWRRAWDKCQCSSAVWTVRQNQIQSHRRLWSRCRLQTRSIKSWHWSSQWGRQKLWFRICKNWVTTSLDILSEKNELQHFRKDRMGTLGTRTWNHGLVAPGYMIIAFEYSWTWVSSRRAMVIAWLLQT